MLVHARHAVSVLALPAALLLASCASSGAAEEARGAGPAAGAAPAFAPSLCQDGLCWLDPVPQGNPLRAASTTPSGTTWAVGDHGVVLRHRGAGWEALAVPKETRPDGTEAYRNLRAVHARAEDDVWIVGEGGAVFHFDGTGVSSVAIPGASGAELHAVHAAAADDVWVASRRSVWRRAGTSWSEVFTAEIEGVPATLVGMWASAADDVWLLGATAAGVARLWHFAGESWTAERLTPESNDVLVAAGAPVAIAGGAPGEPWIAFEQRVVARVATGGLRTIYEVPISNRMDVEPVVGLRVRAEDDAWLAFAAGPVSHRTGASRFEPSVPGYGFGEGPDARPLVLRAGGRLSDPLASGAASRAIEAPPRGCAPSGRVVACAPTKDDVSVRANARGDVATFSPSGPVVVRDAQGTRELAAPGEQFVEIRDLALSADGAVLLLTRSSTLYRAAPGQRSFTKVAAWARDEESSCRLHQPADDVAFASCIYVDPDVPERMELRVHEMDGALASKTPLPQLFSLDPPVAITASGVPIFAALTRENTGDPWSAGVFRRSGQSWKKLEVELERPEGVLVTAWGETVVAHVPSDTDREMGALLTVFEGGASRRLRVPASGLSRLVGSAGGVFGERSAAEAASRSFPVPVRSAFVLSLAP